MTKKTEGAATDTPVSTRETDELTALREEVMDLRGLVEALTGRIDLLETAPAPAANLSPTVSRKLTDTVEEQVTGKPNTAAMADNLSDEGRRKWEEITERRQAAAASRNRRPSADDSSKLNQVLNEIEGMNLGAARVRLDAMKVKGVIGSYLVLPPGSTSPGDVVPGRLRISVDQYQVIIRAEMG